MDFKIKLRTSMDAKPIERIVKSGTSIEELEREYRSHLPYPIVTARINNEDVPMTHKITEPCIVTFCNIRHDAANRTYQRSLCLLYLKAVNDLFKDTEVVIRNSIDRGLYTTIEKGTQITEEDLPLIEKRMWEMVDESIPINRTFVGKQMLLEFIKENYSSEKYDLMRNSPDLKHISVCELDGYTNYFYGMLVPSTRYLTPFKLEKYHEGVLLCFPHPSKPESIVEYRVDEKLFTAVEEEKKILDSYGLSYLSDLARNILDGKAEEIIEKSETLHQMEIDEMAEKIARSGKRLILISGPSSSGKTTFSKRLIKSIERCGKKTVYLGTDDYFVDREDTPTDENGEHNYEGLNALDLDLFQNDVKSLLDGEETDLPTYDFISGMKVFGERILKLKEDELLLIEGIHALNGKLTKTIDKDTKYKIYISPLTQLNIDDHNRVPSTDVRLLRRMIRDNRTRGNSISETMRLWPKVRAGETVNIFPYNLEADVVFNSSLVYELPVIRKYAEPLLREIKEDDEEYGRAKWLLYFLSFFTNIEDDSSIPKESILREFIGGAE